MKIARVTYQDSTYLARIDDEGHAVLLHEESAHPSADALREALAADTSFTKDGRTVPIGDYMLRSPVRNPSKFFGVGMNYREHALEGRFEVPNTPIFFLKTPNTIIGPNEGIVVRRSTTEQPDFEVELVIVIGEVIDGDSPPEAVKEAILGYTVGNDVTAHDAQFSDVQWPRSKCFDTFGPLGPWIVTSDELDPMSLSLWCDVSGERMQNGHTRELVFGPEELVGYLARSITLLPGDLITTGTPSGVGFARKPPRFLRHGDTVTVGVAGIGELTNTVSALD